MEANKTAMRVVDGAVVALRYRMTNSKGIELENIISGPSINYIHGSGNIDPLLESELTGLTAGDCKTIFISTDRGFENIDDYFTVEVIVDEVRPATEQLKYSDGRPTKGCNGPGCCE